MKDLASKLNEFIEVPEGQARLTKLEERLYRSLRTQGERATKGRSISRCVFESHPGEEGARLVMIMEGRYSVSVGNQIVRRFAGMPEVGSVIVKRTDAGAKVVLRLVG